MSLHLTEELNCLPAVYKIKTKLLRPTEKALHIWFQISFLPCSFPGWCQLPQFPHPQASYNVFLKHITHGITIICPQISVWSEELWGKKKKTILSLDNFKQARTLQFASRSFSLLPNPLYFAYLYPLLGPWRHLIYASWTGTAFASW